MEKEQERRGEREKEGQGGGRGITALTARHHDTATGADWTVIAFWVRLIDMGTGGRAEGRAATSTLKPCLKRRAGDERAVINRLHREPSGTESQPFSVLPNSH